jgi:hypothetical protein
MRQLRMSWTTEQGHLVCRWIELKEANRFEPFSFPNRYTSPMVQGSNRQRHLSGLGVK